MQQQRCYEMEMGLSRSLVFPESIELLVVPITGTIIHIRILCSFQESIFRIQNTEMSDAKPFKSQTTS